MLTQRHVIIISRSLAAFTITVGGAFCLVSWWYIKFRLDEEIKVIPLMLLFTLHLGALTGLQASVGGILGMIVFNVLSLIAPIYLNVPFSPGYWICSLYIMLICAELLLLIFCLIKRKSSISTD